MPLATTRGRVADCHRVFSTSRVCSNLVRTCTMRGYQAQTAGRATAPRQVTPVNPRRGGLSQAVALETLQRPTGIIDYEQQYAQPHYYAPEPVDAVLLNRQLEAKAKALIKLEEQEIATRTLVKIRVQREVGLGEAWKVVGKVPELGRFTPEVAPYMKWNNGHEWSFDAKLRPGRWEFKLVLRKSDGAYVWEEGPDRVIEVPASNNGGRQEIVEIRINSIKLPA